MKVFFIVLLVAAFFATGCTVDPATGTTELFGVIPVSESVIETAEAVAKEGKSQGGILGILFGGASVAFAWWRRRKELAATDKAGKLKLAATSVIDGVDLILKKIEEAKASGESWTPTKEELLALLKAAQNSAGTRPDVDELIQEKSTA